MSNLLSFKKFSLVAFSILAVICIGALGAQAAAPNEYKPSTVISNLFGGNQQKDKDPYTALVPDSELGKKDGSVAPDDSNYVAKLNLCDLALKFPKKVNNQ